MSRPYRLRRDHSLSCPARAGEGRCVSWCQAHEEEEGALSTPVATGDVLTDPIVTLAPSWVYQ